ncbi:MAG TPA: DUF485 domain-containing protein [Bacillales bacterium]|nr:DUF485 domain-containing protein [Bacillales bacterium]
MKQEDRIMLEQLMQAKKRFLIPATAFSVVFYFMLPISIISFPKAMNHPVFAGLTPAWVFAFAQFAMVWVLGALYYFRSESFDRLSRQIEDEG